MKKTVFSIYQKIGFAALGLVAITLFTIFLSRKARELRLKQESVVEGLTLNDIGNFFDKLGNGIENLPSEITNGVSGIVNDATNTILGPIEYIINEIEKVFTGIPNLGEGIYNNLKCGAQETKNGADYGLDIFKIILQCAWDKQIKFWNGSCTRYYIADVLFGIFYGVFIELPLLLIYAITGLDLQFLVNLILEVIILPIDTVVFALSGFHITKWPESVIEDCYRCKGTMDFGDETGTQTVYRTMGQWGSMLNCTTHQFIHGLAKIFSSAPSPQWTTWYNGNDLDGQDNVNVFGL